MYPLEGKTALVTGACGGIGSAIVECLAEQGADVFVCGTCPERVEAQVQKLQAEHSSNVFWGLSFSMDDLAAADKALSMVRNEAGKLDILINNAGINIRGPLAEMRDEDWYKVMEVNLNGVFRLCRASFPLLSVRGGKVLNICSFMAEFARPNVTAYAASKAGLRQLTRALAVEWAPHDIQVNALAPGFIDTQINAVNKADPEFYRKTIARTPAGRWGQPQEVGSVAAFLVGPAASFITGQMLCVDGGLSISL